MPSGHQSLANAIAGATHQLLPSWLAPPPLYTTSQAAHRAPGSAPQAHIHLLSLDSQAINKQRGRGCSDTDDAVPFPSLLEDTSVFSAPSLTSANPSTVPWALLTTRRQQNRPITATPTTVTAAGLPAANTSAAAPMPTASMTTSSATSSAARPTVRTIPARQSRPSALPPTNTTTSASHAAMAMEVQVSAARQQRVFPALSWEESRQPAELRQRRICAILQYTPPSSGLYIHVGQIFTHTVFFCAHFSAFAFIFSFPVQPSPCFPFAGDSNFFSVGMRTWAPAQARASSACPHQDPSSSGAVARPYLRRPDDSRSASRHIHCRSSRAKYRRSNYL